MRKTLFVAVAALAVSCASVGYAAQAEPFSRPRRFSSEDMSAFTNARIAAMKAGLMLTADQEKNWPALETAMREIDTARMARREEMREKGGFGALESDPLGALQTRAKALTSRAAELEKLSAAARPLYDSLDDAQKRRFGSLLKATIQQRMGPGRGHGRGHGHGMWGGGFGGPGME